MNCNVVIHKCDDYKFSIIFDISWLEDLSKIDCLEISVEAWAHVISMSGLTINDLIRYHNQFVDLGAFNFKISGINCQLKMTDSEFVDAINEFRYFISTLMKCARIINPSIKFDELE